MFECSECGRFKINPFSKMCVQCSIDYAHDKKLMEKNQADMDKAFERIDQLRDATPSNIYDKQTWVLDNDLMLSEMDFFNILSLPTSEELNLVAQTAIQCYDLWAENPTGRPDQMFLRELSERGVQEEYLNAAGQLIEMAKQADTKSLFDNDDEFRAWVKNSTPDMPSSICTFAVLKHVSANP